MMETAGSYSGPEEKIAEPSFLIIGAQKSGTTSLAFYLRSHPDVFMPEKPVYYFDRNLDRGIEWYRSHFDAARGRETVGEGNPEYMYHAHVPELIARALPAAKLIVVLRDPVDRAYSHYWHNRTRGHEDLSFEEAIAAEPERLRKGDLYARSRFSYVDRGRYVTQLERVTQHFARAQLFVAFLDELKTARVRVIQSTFNFLGVGEDFVPERLTTVKNRFVTFRSNRLRRPIRRLPPPLRRVAGRLNIRYADYPPIPPKLRDRLGDQFRDDNDALAKWLGRDLPEWT